MPGGTPLDRFVADIWPAVRDRLPADWRAEPVSVRLAGPRAAPAPSVLRVALGTGRVLALKFGGDLAALQREAQALTWLDRLACPVPRVLGYDVGAGWIASEWRGDRTLDDTVQRASPARRRAVGSALADALATVDAAFGTLGAGDPAPAIAALRTALWEALAPAPAAVAWLLDRGPAAGSTDLLAVAETAAGGVPLYGSLDVNARNVVVRGPGLWFVDFSRVGLDWPARRLVQYGTAVGSRAATGTYGSVVDEAAAAYAARAAPLCGLTPTQLVHAVDAHDLLLVVRAASQLGAVADLPRSGWSDLAPRKAALRALLLRRIAPDGPAERFRQALR